MPEDDGCFSEERNVRCRDLALGGLFPAMSALFYCLAENAEEVEGLDKGFSALVDPDALTRALRAR